MLFTSIAFFVFLPIVFVIYWFLLGNNRKLQNCFVVAASFLFYGWWDWRFLILMTVTIVLSYYTGLEIANSDTCSRKRFFLLLNVVVNLLILGIFKYYNFFVDSLSEMMSAFGCSLDFPTLRIILPVGISFYTFQSLSYSVDVYRDKVKPTSDVVAFFAFVSFFPQLVAGPIERATNLLPQFLEKRHFDYDMAVDGSRQILWGFFKKVVIADNCANYVNMAFGDYAHHSGGTLLFAAIFFSFQIYGDFSGYSDIAIGVSKLFGIRLCDNFRTPYFSRDIAEFWRRWHISLNTWFREYVYIPLGGSRVSPLKVVRNTFVIFLLSGLWHGANWTFICWGAFHAFLFLPLILLHRNRRYADNVASGKLLPSVGEVCSMVFTFVLVMFGWIIFRAETMSDAMNYMAQMVTNNPFCLPSRWQPYFYPLLVSIAVCLLVEWLQREQRHGLDLCRVKSRGSRYAIYLSLFFYMLAYSGTNGAFIYFQF